MAQVHEGSVELQHTFSDTWHWLKTMGEVGLSTSVGTPFEFVAAMTKSGKYRDQPVIRFFQRDKEYGRAYKCCWGHYWNCNRTWIGMYCEALDAAVP